MNAQNIMRVSGRPGSASTRVILTLQPNFNFNQQLNEVGFAIMVPKAPGGIPIPPPTVTVLSTCATCLNTTFPAASWVQANDFVSDPNWYLYKLGCVSNLGTAPVLVINNGNIQDILEVQFAGSTVNPTDIRFAHLATGGPGTLYGLSIYDGLSNDLVNYVQMFTGAGSVPAAPHPDEITGYNNLQYFIVSSVVLPINWLSFDAVKSGHDALLSWKVSDEESNLRYELLRSVNGTDFLPVATVNKTGSGNSVKNYTYTDPNIDALNVGIIYYRLKQVSIDGRSSLSEIRIVKLSNGNGEITVFPNPVKDGFYVNVPLAGVDRSIVKLNLVTVSGQLVQSKEITALQASNYYFDVKGLSLSAGQYNLQIIREGKVLATKKLLVNK
jgi:hypothetical protein